MADVNQNIRINLIMKGFGVVNNRLKKVSNNVRGFGFALGENMEMFKKTSPHLKEFGNRGAQVGSRLRTMTHGARGFRMEMLGIMFFGMAINRAFGSLIRTSKEWMGVTEVLTTTLGILFLPLAETLLNWALKFMEIVGGLSERQKKWIGIIVLVGMALAGIIFLVGTFALGIGSLIQAFALFGGAATSVVTVASAIGSVLLVLGGLILIVKGVYDIFKGKFEGIGLIITGIGIILLLFIGWWALIPIAVGLAAFWVIKHWEKVKGWFSSFWGWLKSSAKAAIDFLKNAFLSFTGLGLVMKIGSKVLGSFQTGGVVPQTGPYMLHQGETVVPTQGGGGGFAPTINITASVSSDYDVRRLAEELKRYWVSDFERVSQGRTV